MVFGGFGVSSPEIMKILGCQPKFTYTSDNARGMYQKNFWVSGVFLHHGKFCGAFLTRVLIFFFPSTPGCTRISCGFLPVAFLK
jgi:hypothetical protein